MPANPHDRRIIEVEMPLTKISEHSAREKSIRHGHLSTLHIWWARRPLAACRAAIFAALVPQPEDPAAAQKLQHFIASLANWDNSIDSTSALGGKEAHHFIKDARAYIKQAFPDRAPRVLDPFSGGGAIPLEALRLGCETYAFDLNPVAHIIQLATLVYPQQYAHRPGAPSEKPGATLVADVQRWSAWVLDRARAEIGDLYPQDQGAAAVAYLWARTIACPRADCAVAVPLIRQTWLAKKPGRMSAYKVEADGPGSAIRYTVIGPVKSVSDFDFDPGVGSTRGGTAVCPCCGTPLGEKYIKDEAVNGRMGDEMVAVVWESSNGKLYRSVRPEDRAAFEQATQRLHQLEASYDPLSGELSPVPDEPMPPQGTLGFRVRRYGIDTWGKLFNPRQALALATFVRWVRAAHTEIAQQTGDAEYAKAVTTYLALTFDRLVNRGSVLCVWHNGAKYELVNHVFARQALPMVWDYAEVNPFNASSGGWEGAVEWVTRYIDHGATIATSIAESSLQATPAKAASPDGRAALPYAEVRRGSATKLPFDDGFFDAVITDPPYYDNVPYSDLSDFFYVWLRRTLGDLYPTVLGTPLTPKEQEITQDPSKQKSKADFERMLGSAFAEMARVLQKDGICVVVYAHKAISAWETLVAALLNAGLTVDGSWPFSTEMANRLRGQNSAALASSIFLVCRKRTVEAGVGIASDVRVAIEANVRERLDQFWAAGLRGADFFISAIGPATAAFSRYDSVRDLRGNEITVSTLLEWVQQTVADYALRRVFAVATSAEASTPTVTSAEASTPTRIMESRLQPDKPDTPTRIMESRLQPDKPDNATTSLGVVDDETRFYVLWRWTYDHVVSVVGATGESGVKKKTGPLPPLPDADESGDGDTESGESASGAGKADKQKKIPFGDAHLMATALGADIHALIHRFQILAGKSDVVLLSAAERADGLADFGERRADGSRPPLIDVLHRCELLWAANQSDELADYLSEFAPDEREALRRVAQALIDVLPRGDLEKQRLEGFLYSGVAQQRGDGPRTAGNAPVQQGMEGMGVADKVLREKRKGQYRKS